MQNVGCVVRVISCQESKHSNLQVKIHGLAFIKYLFFNKREIEILFHLGLSFHHTQDLTQFCFNLLLTEKSPQIEGG